MGFGSVPWEQLFLYQFQVCNLLGDDRNFKMVRGCKKEEDQISMKEVFFSLASIKAYVTFCSCYFCFSRYYTKGEMPRIKLMTV